jgi:hypothetical protein
MSDIPGLASETRDANPFRHNFMPPTLAYQQTRPAVAQPAAPSETSSPSSHSSLSGSLFGSPLSASCAADFFPARLLGIAFQYFTIKPGGGPNLSTVCFL